MSVCLARRCFAKRIALAGTALMLALASASAQQYQSEPNEGYRSGRAARRQAPAEPDSGTRAARTPAPGGQYRGTTEDREACTGDVLRLCKEYIPDVSRIVVCLQASRSNLSPACSAVFARRFGGG